MKSFQTFKPTIGHRLVQMSVLLTGWCFSALVQAQICPHRGDLDEAYCDANRDLVADGPSVGKNPDRLVIGVSSTEDAQTAMKTYVSLIDYLKTCLRKDVQLHPPVGESNVLEGMRMGQVHVGQFATGATMYAVNFAGGCPLQVKAHPQQASVIPIR